MEADAKSPLTCRCSAARNCYRYRCCSTTAHATTLCALGPCHTHPPARTRARRALCASLNRGCNSPAPRAPAPRVARTQEKTTS